MNVLGIETSCDETAAAVVVDDGTVLSSAVFSQVALHRPHGGVVPEIASRQHVEQLPRMLDEALVQSGLQWPRLQAVAVTYGPGLASSLLVGLSAAKALALRLNIPLIGINHLEAHLYSVFLTRDAPRYESVCPLVALIVSGGHTCLVRVDAPGQYRRLGQTIDDAAGEAFDKVAKMLGLGYPGGPLVSKYGEKGDRRSIELPKIYLKKDSLDFSFSGLKASVYRLLETRSEEVDEAFISNVCASFEYTVGKIFEKKVERVLDRFPEIKQVHFTGGVSANTYLKGVLTTLCSKNNCEFLTPKNIEYSTDNAAMIGAAAFQLVKNNPKIAKIQHIDAQSRLNLGEFLDHHREAVKN